MLWPGRARLFVFMTTSQLVKKRVVLAYPVARMGLLPWEVMQGMNTHGFNSIIDEAFLSVYSSTKHAVTLG